MSELQTIVTGIAVKVRELADRQRSLISENEALTQLNEDLANELAAQKMPIRSFLNRINWLKLQGP